MHHRLALLFLLGAAALNAQDLVVVNAASFAEGFPIAPESIASAFGPDLAPETEGALESPLPTTLGGVNTLLIDSTGQQFECPMFFASPGQVNFFVPLGVATGFATIRIVPAAGAGNFTEGTVEIAPVSTGLFTTPDDNQWLTAFFLRVEPDGTQTFIDTVVFDAAGDIVANPLQMSPNGDDSDQYFLILFGTGNRGSGDLSAVHTYVGFDDAVGAPADEIPTLFNGPQGEFIGLDQTNAGPLPRDLEWFGGGRRSVAIEVDGDFSNIGWIVIEANPLAPVISNPTFEFVQGSPPEIIYEFDFEDADGDFDEFEVSWLWEDSQRFCRSSLELTASALAGDTAGRVQFSDPKEEGTQLGDIESVRFSVTDAAGNVSNELTFEPALGSLPGFAESCDEIIEK